MDLYFVYLCEMYFCQFEDFGYFKVFSVRENSFLHVNLIAGKYWKKKKEKSLLKPVIVTFLWNSLPCKQKQTSLFRK